jgi:hypothetical protein
MIQSRGISSDASPAVNPGFDFAERAQNSSNVETPDPEPWEIPFAKDSLGETVIHLDKARILFRLLLQFSLRFIV